ncbi:MAG TPA: histidine phosphatase family protein [Bacillota bacterium]|nr:histidine phosphatase family protein [Bacillota bacterium]
MKERKLYLIRHGITEGNINKYYYGRTDVSLAPEGITELKEFSEKGIYPMPAPDFVFTSGMQRTEESLSVIYGDTRHHILEELKELDFGDYEMRSHGELMETAEYSDWFASGSERTGFPGGEDLIAFERRVMKGYEKMLSAFDEEGMAVCHGGVISVIMMNCFPDPQMNLFSWIPEPGRGFVIKLKEEEAVNWERI